MISSSVRLAGHVHKPLIRFLGKRVYDSPAPPATSHPLAPEDIKSKFSDFINLQKNPQSSPTSSSSSSSSSPSSNQSKERVFWYDDISQLPWSYNPLSSAEIELINGGGVIR
ncbi:hypothetical protein MJO28_002280 [Puccinia striiformis f. sp. tritici]|uniref:Uncharacterized protein n=5 Tax=Puccinia striiformis TaxID=27350 RepID=A0A0L0VU33_9BASI|nr:hypothetical protein Pst134EA_028181 [Puccinia striiformis f. sp. tritici]KNF02722.1 hypothetical protein PSTG_04008 [Puccinia striiformis f. sp. tritici PST-78]POW04139.1 hypothetical protein PSHT_11377 [Puccinia striiformis]KAH9442475.1 hypothetical protein Pst134EB_028726 [Puccinia striiformis f. sp. tritici]KAH9448889.1 hypothetical protein Pst134EA_028181 [Puccinia striiformis f. sp. tritici]KAI7937813.1 hypothetical protein MJO29_015128 [Puccinia striiformis f. sp. tritici]